MQKYNIKYITDFINDIKKYLISPKYIKIQNKPLVGIYDPASIPEVKSFLVELRKEARAEKNWEVADKIRIALDKAGIILKDSKEGTTWELK